MHKKKLHDIRVNTQNKDLTGAKNTEEGRGSKLTSAPHAHQYESAENRTVKIVALREKSLFEDFGEIALHKYAKLKSPDQIVNIDQTTTHDTLK